MAGTAAPRTLTALLSKPERRPARPAPVTPTWSVTGVEHPVRKPSATPGPAPGKRVSENSLTSTLRRVPPASRRAAALPPEERREALIAATLPLVLEHGTDVSTRLIAEAAGVAEGTIFRVFPSKDDLVEAVVASAYDPSLLVDSLARIDRTAPLTVRLVAAVELVQRRLQRISHLVSALAAHRPQPEALALLVEPDRDLLRCSPQEVARRLRLVTLGLSHPRLVDADPLPAEEIVSMLLDGLRTRPATGAAVQSPAHASLGVPSC
jgi:AcrR family transcriptional regulator